MIKKNFENSSIYKTMQAYKDGRVDAVLPQGNTRWVVLASYEVLGKIKGVSQAGIPVILPKNNVLIDSGAAPFCNGDDLLHFAIMGSIFSKEILKVEKPKIAIYNIGTEESKGVKSIFRAKIESDICLKIQEGLKNYGKV